MTRKIFLSITLISVAAVAMTIALITGLLSRSYRTHVKEQLRDEGIIIASGVEMNGGKFLDSTDFGDLRVTWISSGGRVIFDTDKDPTAMDSHSQREEVKEAFSSGEGSAVRYSDTIRTTSLNYAKKLADGSVIRVSTDHFSFINGLASVLQPLMMILAAAALLGLLAAITVSKRIVKPINSIDLDRPDISGSYRELSPLLTKLSAQNKRAGRQVEELRRSREQFSLITESMSEGLIIAGSKGNILACNSGASRLLGAEPPADGASIFTLNSSEPFRRCIQDAMGGKRSELILSTEGCDRQIIASPSSGVTGVTGIVVFIIDVTERQQLETLRREFTSNVSHELKTPLTTIYGISDMLANGIVRQEDIERFGGEIRSEAQRMISLINDIVSLSKLDEDSVPRQDEEVDLYDLAQQVLSRLRSNADGKQLTLSLTGEHVKFFGNKTVLDEIIMNLCDNAVKYNVSGGAVEVKISHIPTKARITVSDTGTGIPPGDLDRIFERFYRVDKSRSRKIGGTGLGLSIVKHGVSYLGGAVRAESVPGKGSVFTVELPTLPRKK
ncbi:MAG TPA: ATP-binding protein [Ruminococcus sp.]|nr:ATP-binding protein [Ruminococcus sp.]